MQLQKKSCTSLNLLLYVKIATREKEEHTGKHFPEDHDCAIAPVLVGTKSGKTQNKDLAVKLRETYSRRKSNRKSIGIIRTGIIRFMMIIRTGIIRTQRHSQVEKGGP